LIELAFVFVFVYSELMT